MGDCPLNIAKLLHHYSLMMPCIIERGLHLHNELTGQRFLDLTAFLLL